MSDSATPWTASPQAPMSMRLSRQEYWSGLPFSSPEDFPDPGIEHESPALAGVFFTTSAPGKPYIDIDKGTDINVDIDIDIDIKICMDGRIWN